jgi:hypothetical protein
MVMRYGNGSTASTLADAIAGPAEEEICANPKLSSVAKNSPSRSARLI